MTRKSFTLLAKLLSPAGQALHQGRAVRHRLGRHRRHRRGAVARHPRAARRPRRRRGRAALHRHRPRPGLSLRRAGVRSTGLAPTRRCGPTATTRAWSAATASSPLLERGARRRPRRPAPDRLRHRRGGHRQDRAGRGVPASARGDGDTWIGAGPLHRAVRHRRGLSADPRGARATGARRSAPTPCARCCALRAGLAGAAALAGPRRRRRAAAPRHRREQRPAHAARDRPGARGAGGRTADRALARGPALERPVEPGGDRLPGRPARAGAAAAHRQLPARRRAGGAVAAARPGAAADAARPGERVALDLLDEAAVAPVPACALRQARALPARRARRLPAPPHRRQCAVHRRDGRRPGAPRRLVAGRTAPGCCAAASPSSATACPTTCAISSTTRSSASAKRIAA